MYTFPNQKVIYSKKNKCTENFLQVCNSDWMEAFQSLNKAALGIYLYLAKNEAEAEAGRKGRKYKGWALSPKDIEASIGIGRDTYKKAVKELEKKGYLVHKRGNIWDFHSSAMGCSSTTLNADEEGMGCSSAPVCGAPVPDDVMPQYPSMGYSSTTETKIKEEKEIKEKDAPAELDGETSSPSIAFGVGYVSPKERERLGRKNALSKNEPLLEKLSGYSGYPAEEVLEELSYWEDVDWGKLSAYVDSTDKSNRESYENNPIKAWDGYWSYLKCNYSDYVLLNGLNDWDIYDDFTGKVDAERLFGVSSRRRDALVFD